jgi:signal transduction histidine kinase
MAMEENSPTMEHYIQVAQQSTKRLDTILQNLIELTKIKSAEMVMAPVDIWELIKDILAGFSNLPEFGRVKTITEVRLTRPFYSDDRLLRAVLQNLIENAIKYSRHNIADAYAQVLVEEVEDGMVKITVEDNGEGIPKAHLDKVFNMFFRATESSKGSGLGLYILRNALDKLQGTVHVDSDLGKGTRFTVFLPQQPTQ